VDHRRAIRLRHHPAVEDRKAMRLRHPRAVAEVPLDPAAEIRMAGTGLIWVVVATIDRMPAALHVLTLTALLDPTTAPTGPAQIHHRMIDMVSLLPLQLKGNHSTDAMARCRARENNRQEATSRRM
jgi:hypothetical protein